MSAPSRVASSSEGRQRGRIKRDGATKRSVSRSLVAKKICKVLKRPPPAARHRMSFAFTPDDLGSAYSKAFLYTGRMSSSCSSEFLSEAAPGHLIGWAVFTVM